jgi:hypothetical protein
MEYDALADLRSAGYLVELFPSGQRRVLAGLTEAEVSVLNRLKLALDAAAPEVEGMAEVKLL